MAGTVVTVGMKIGRLEGRHRMILLAENGAGDRRCRIELQAVTGKWAVVIGKW